MHLHPHLLPTVIKKMCDNNMAAENLTELSQFAVIKLTGPESYSFLQGQVTCDTSLLKQQTWLPGCHCNAKGKMWSSFFAVRHEDDILLVLSKDSAEHTLTELNKYGVFAKTDITDDSDNWHIYGATEQVAGAISLELAEQHYLLISRDKLEHKAEPAAWWQREILSGRAHLFAGTIAEYVPQMLNLQALDYISFTKGCYMGQEMVARMRYLGKNKRALYLAKCDQALTVNIADDVAIELNGNKRNVGKVIQTQTYQGQTWLQLVLPKDTELTETIYLSSGHSAELIKLPYQIEQ